MKDLRDFEFIELKTEWVTDCESEDATRHIYHYSPTTNIQNFQMFV